MTVEELSELYYINKEIEKIQRELIELREKNFYKKPMLSDLPKGNKIIDENLKYLEAMEQLEQQLNFSLLELQKKRMAAEEFLQTIKNAEDRLIVRLRVIDNMKWQEIADEIGLERTTVSKRFYKFFTIQNSHKSHCTYDII